MWQNNRKLKKKALGIRLIKREKRYKVSQSQIAYN